jgi:hypothetical protein
MMGRASIFPATTTARSLIACMPRMADCGGLMMGVDSSEPYTPPLLMVNVPPAMSSMLIVPSRAFLPSRPMACTCRVTQLMRPQTQTAMPLPDRQAGRPMH